MALATRGEMEVLDVKALQTKSVGAGGEKRFRVLSLGS